MRYLRLVALMWENDNELTFQRAEMRMIRWMCGVKLTKTACEGVNSFLLRAHLGHHGRRAVKRVAVLLFFMWEARNREKMMYLSAVDENTRNVGRAAW